MSLRTRSSSSSVETRVASSTPPRSLRIQRKRLINDSDVVQCSPSPKSKRGLFEVDENLDEKMTPSKKCKRLTEGGINVRVRLTLSPVKSVKETPKKHNPLHKTLQVLQESAMVLPVCREAELDAIGDFMSQKLGHRLPGSLYITGPPGTGKTACVMHAVHNNEMNCAKFKTIVINCMTLSTARNVIKKIAEELDRPSEKLNIFQFVKQQLCRKGPMILLVLDEMDQLESRNQEVLYNVFEWSCLPNSRLVLIGLANALEPLDSTLPRLQLLTQHETQILQFAPYSKDQIKHIIQDRLQQCKEDQVDDVLTPVVIEYCSRNAAAHNGDVRKALGMLSQATMLLMNSTKESPLKTKSSVTSSSGSSQVKLHHVQQVVSSVSNSLAWADRTKIQLPLQQKILVFCLIAALNRHKGKGITLGTLFEIYSQICRKQKLSVVDSAELLSLCVQLEDCGIVGLERKGKDKEARLARVFLRVNELDLEPILRQERLLSVMLDDKAKFLTTK